MYKKPSLDTYQLMANPMRNMDFGARWQIQRVWTLYSEREIGLVLLRQQDPDFYTNALD